MTLIMTGVASTPTRPLPTRGAVCSMPTSNSADPFSPMVKSERSTACGSCADGPDNIPALAGANCCPSKGDRPVPLAKIHVVEGHYRRQKEQPGGGRFGLER